MTRIIGICTPKKNGARPQTQWEDLLEAALDEGEPIEADEPFWKGRQAGAMARIKARKKAGSE